MKILFTYESQICIFVCSQTRKGKTNFALIKFCGCCTDFAVKWNHRFGVSAWLVAHTYKIPCNGVNRTWHRIYANKTETQNVHNWTFISVCGVISLKLIYKRVCVYMCVIKALDFEGMHMYTHQSTNTKLYIQFSLFIYIHRYAGNFKGKQVLVTILVSV